MSRKMHLHRYAMFALLIVVLLSVSSCADAPQVDTPEPTPDSPVHITVPESGAVIKVGEHFRVVARINVRYPVGGVRVHLADVINPGAISIWNFDNPPHSRSFLFAQTVQLPADFNVNEGGEYRLSVDAVPLEESGLSVSQSYTIKVEVIE